MLYRTTWTPGTFVLADLNNDNLVDAASISAGTISIWMNPATGATAVHPGSGVPTSFWLSQNYPNPFNAITRIRYTLPKAVHVTVRVYNILGQEVATLLDDQRPAGIHVLQWDGRDRYHRPVSTGVYLCAMKAGEWRKAIKMLVVK